MHLQPRLKSVTIYNKKISRLLIPHFQEFRRTISNSISLPSAFGSAAVDFGDHLLVRRQDYPPTFMSFQDFIISKQTEERKLRTSLENAYAIASPVNLLRFALLGDLVNRKKSQCTRDHIYVLRNVKVSDTNKEKIKKLTHRFWSNLSVENMHACEILSKIAHLSEQNTHLLHFQLSHILSLISSTRNGCSALALPKVDEILIRAVHNTEVNSMNRNFIPNGYHRQVTSNYVYMSINLNNLVLNMISRGITPGPRLAGKSLKTAANRMQFRNIQMYLEMFNKNKHSVSSRIKQALTALARNIIQYQNPQNFAGMLESERAEIIRLSLQIITGWENNGVPGPLENRKNSFGLLTQPKVPQPSFSCTTFYTAYICVLADLGLTQALQHEWFLLPDSSRNEYISYLFATAFLIAKEPQIALSKLESHFEENNSKPILEVDSIDDFKVFEKMYPGLHVSHIFLTLYSHYRLKTTDNIRNKLENIRLPGSPREILEILVEFIPPRPNIKLTTSKNQGTHYLSPKYLINGLHEEDTLIEWSRDVYGEVGLLVSSEGGKKPLHWRPASLSKRQLYKALSIQET